MSVYATSCVDYYRAGWAGVIPVPPGTKYPPPEGTTGADGTDPSPEKIAAWSAGEYRDHSIALRMPEGVLAIDVDQYEKKGVQKNGAATLAAREEQWGPLPATWSCTARGDDYGPGPSRTMFFRVPPRRYAAQLGPDVEILQRHHRYAVVAPSLHPETGSPYRWYEQDGMASGRVPSPAELAELPADWVTGLAEGATTASPAASSREAGLDLLDALAGGNGLRCIAVTTALSQALAACASPSPGSRHDLMTEHVYQLVMLGSEGHPGAGGALEELRGEWERLMSGEPGRFDEFDRMLLTAARKAVTRNGLVPDAADPCTSMFGLTYTAPAADGQVGGAIFEPVMPERQWSAYSAIGGWEFAPQTMSDALLARDVLQRAYPVTRYCPDAGAWIVRGPEHWTVRKGELARWAVALMHPLMQPGDPEADPNTVTGQVLITQAKRRARFTANASANAIAGQMHAQVMAGYHPCAIELADLDQDHEILWAGGMAYDLRASAEGPAFAPVDPGIPHIHSAGVVPDVRETPLWDKFLAAVWPDPEVRAWALRVLSVALTGYSDKALPILVGDTNRGKTQVIALLMSVLGSYAHAADPRLLSPADRSHASIVYALKGRRLSFIDESPKKGNQAQERLKQLTGGAELTGNRMGENPVTFLPTHTLVLTANREHEPDMTDGAVRSRTRLIPCDGDPDAVRAARAAIGNTGSPQWREEAPGVLAKMMAEAAAYLADQGSASTERGPLVVQEAADEVASAQDLVYSWVTEECEHWEAGTPARQLYLAFTESCRRLFGWSFRPPSEKTWGVRLNELGYPVRKTSKCNVRQLRVRIPGSAFEAEPPRTPVRGGSVEGQWTDESATLHPQNPSSNHPPLSTVEGVEGQLPVLTYAHTHTHTQENGDLPPHPPTVHAGTVIFDLETGSAGDLFTYTQSDDTGYVRLAGWSDGDTVTCASAAELLPVLEDAAEICGHNIMGFDLLALAHHHGADWEKLAAKARDTELIERQANPPRSRESGASEDAYDLDHVAGRLGLPGKTDSIAALKRKHGGYDKIPLDDPDYRAYLEGDVRATAAVAALRHNDAYTEREHKVAALAGRMTLNGFLVDRPLLEERLAAGQARKREALQFLHDAWGLPLSRTVMRGRGSARHEVTEEIASPLATDAGRDWLAGMYERYQIPEPPRSPKTQKLATGADDLKTVAADPRCPQDLKSAIKLIGIVVGTRTVYQTATDCLAPDGRVHPVNSFRQASGRWSVTNPGLTVFGKRGGRHIERDIFLPDPGHVLVSFDLSQVDMRSMAWLSQDHAYRALFAPGRDAHSDIAAQIGITRDAAKAIGHGWNYGLGAKRMIAEGKDPDLVNAFVAGMQERFPVLIAWREQIREQGKAGMILDNGFGRRMRCDPARAYTVAPALMGQGGARDIMCESLLRLPREIWPMLRVMVHDEIVCSVPKDSVLEVAETVLQAMTWQLDDDLPVLCDMSAGNTWGEASAK